MTPPEPAEELEHHLYRYTRDSPDVPLTWEPVRRLSEAEFQDVSTALATVTKLLRRPQSPVEIAYRDLSEYVASLTQRAVDMAVLRRTEDWLPELQYRFIALSAALRMYEEVTMADAGRVSDTTAATEMKTAFSEVYDRSLAYRVIYAMRNLLVHGAGQTLDVKARTWIDEADQKHAHLTLTLRRDVFVKSKAKAAVRGEVAELPTAPDLLAFAHEAVAGVRDIEKVAVRLLHPSRDASVDLLYEYMLELHRLGGGSPRFHTHPPSDPFAVQISELPASGFAYVLEDVRRRHA